MHFVCAPRRHNPPRASTIPSTMINSAISAIPSARTTRRFVHATRKSAAVDAAAPESQSCKAPGPIGSVETAAVRPSTPSRLKMLDPTTFATAISRSP